MNRQHLLRFSLWLMPFHIIVFSALWLSTFGVIDIANDALTQSYFALALISQFAVITLCVLMLTVVLFILPKRLILLWIVLIYALISVFLFIDAIVFQQYRFHINAFVIELIIGGGSEIFDFSALTWLKLSAAIAIIALIEAGGFFIIWRWTRRKHRWGYGITSCVLLIVFASQTLHAWAYQNLYSPILKLTPSIPYYFPLKSHQLIAALNLPELDSQAQKALQKQSGRLVYPKAALECANNTNQNIVLIVVDTLRFDMLDSTIMPNTAQFARENITFTRHFSGGNGTRTGLFSLFYGVPGVYWDDFLQNQRGTVLIDVLKQNNYQLNILTSSALSSPAFDKTIFASVNNLRKRTKIGNSPAERDMQITREFFNFIATKSDDKPFFTFLFYDAPHGYSTPAGFNKPFLPELENIDYFKLNNDYDPSEFFNRYKNAAHFVDTLIGSVLNKLKESGNYDNTTIVLTSDHGQEFNDNKLNYWGHGSNFTRWQLQVPMVLKMADNQNRYITRKTTHLDIVPTLLQNVLNCTNPIRDYSLGFNLLDETPRDYLLAGIKTNYAVVTDELIAVDNNINILQTYNSSNRPTDKRIPLSVFKRVVEDLGWFYKK